MVGTDHSSTGNGRREMRVRVLPPFSKYLTKGETLMTKDELFSLYAKVQNKDKDAEDLLIAVHEKQYPKNRINKLTRGMCGEYRQNLHIMYLNLT